MEVQLKWPPVAYEPVRRVLERGKEHHQLRIELKADHGLVQIPDGRSVAVMDMDSFRPLSQCSTTQGFRLDAWVLETEWNEKLAEAHKIQTSRCKPVLMRVKMVLFGQSVSGIQVATVLGQFKCYLQPPDTGMIDCLYDNPQSLELPDLPPGLEKVNSGARVPVTLMVEELEEMTIPNNKSRDGDAAELVDLLAGIEDWFDKLPSHRPIATVAKDSLVLTTLFPYVI